VCEVCRKIGLAIPLREISVEDELPYPDKPLRVRQVIAILQTLEKTRRELKLAQSLNPQSVIAQLQAHLEEVKERVDICAEAGLV